MEISVENEQKTLGKEHNSLLYWKRFWLALVLSGCWNPSSLNHAKHFVSRMQRWSMNFNLHIWNWWS